MGRSHRACATLRRRDKRGLCRREGALWEFVRLAGTGLTDVRHEHTPQTTGAIPLPRNRSQALPLATPNLPNHSGPVQRCPPVSHKVLPAPTQPARPRPPARDSLPQTSAAAPGRAAKLQPYAAARPLRQCLIRLTLPQWPPTTHGRLP